MRVLLRVIAKELQQLRRDKRMLPMILVTPIAQLVIFGFAANNDVNRIPLVVVDEDRTRASRDLLDRFLASGWFTLAGAEDTAGRVEPWLVSGRAQVGLVIGPHYGRDLAAGRPPRVQVIADGTDSSSAIVGLGYASRIVSGVGAEVIAARLARLAAADGVRAGQGLRLPLDEPAAPGRASPFAAGEAPRAMSFLPGRQDAGPRAEAALRRRGSPSSIDLVPRIWYNPDLESRWFYLPAILALVLLLTTMILPSMAIVREKEIGTLEQIIVTPIRPWQLIVGKLFPFAVIGLFVLALVTSVIVYFFQVPLRGSFGLLVLLSVPFLMTMLGIGLLVSTIAKSQQQAMMSAIYMLMVPMIYLSGLIFPIENMPAIMQKVTYAVPLRYYAVILRGIFLKGSGIGVLWPEALALSGFAIGTLALASLRFRKTLD